MQGVLWFRDIWRMLTWIWTNCLFFSLPRAATNSIRTYPHNFLHLTYQLELDSNSSVLFLCAKYAVDCHCAPQEIQLPLYLIGTNALSQTGLHFLIDFTEMWMEWYMSGACISLDWNKFTVPEYRFRSRINF